MNARLSLLRALAALTVPPNADAAALAEAVNGRQRLLEQLEACGDAELSQEETSALEAARQGQAAWEQRCLDLLHDVESLQDAARGRARHDAAATGRLVNRLG